MENLLPRHMALIYEINLDFLQAVEKIFPGDVARLGRMSVIEEGFPKQVRAKPPSTSRSRAPS